MTMRTKNDKLSRLRRDQFVSDRPTSDIQAFINLENTTRDPFEFLRAQLRDNQSPLTDSRGTDFQCARHVRGGFKVIDGGLLEHGLDLTIVHSVAQPKYSPRVLTLVQMDKLATQAERLEDAMRVNNTNAAELARACGVSATSAGKWLKGGKLSADSLAAASRALGVREEWLRTGRLPREREHAVEERETDRVIELLDQIHGPLVALVTAIEHLSKAQSSTKKRTGS